MTLPVIELTYTLEHRDATVSLVGIDDAIQAYNLDAMAMPPDVTTRGFLLYQGRSYELPALGEVEGDVGVTVLAHIVLHQVTQLELYQDYRGEQPNKQVHHLPDEGGNACLVHDVVSDIRRRINAIINQADKQNNPELNRLWLSYQYHFGYKGQTFAFNPWSTTVQELVNTQIKLLDEIP